MELEGKWNTLITRTRELFQITLQETAHKHCSTPNRKLVTLYRLFHIWKFHFAAEYIYKF
jgi:hypothetical protein